MAPQPAAIQCISRGKRTLQPPNSLLAVCFHALLLLQACKLACLTPPGVTDHNIRRTPGCPPLETAHEHDKPYFHNVNAVSRPSLLAKRRRSPLLLERWQPCGPSNRLCQIATGALTLSEVALAAQPQRALRMLKGPCQSLVTRRSSCGRAEIWAWRGPATRWRWSRARKAALGAFRGCLTAE
jgi:hypothetical protein